MSRDGLGFLPALSEESVVNEHIDFQWKAGKLAESLTKELSSELAYFGVDHPTKTVRLGVKSRLAAESALLSAATGFDLNLDTAIVEWGDTDMKAVSRRLVDDSAHAQLPFTLRSADPRPDEQMFYLGVASEADIPSAREYLSKLFPGLPVTVVVGAEAHAQSSVADDGAEPPYSPGIRISGVGASCTMGWGVENLGAFKSTRFLTAGHCWGGGVAVSQGPHAIANSNFDRTIGGGADVVSVTVPDRSRMSGRTFTTWPSSIGVLGNYSNTERQGMYACFSGSFTMAFSCGVIQSTSVIRIQDGVFLDDLVQTNANTVNGDSGAPVMGIYWNGTRYQALAYGLLSGLYSGGMYYTKLNNDFGAIQGSADRYDTRNENRVFFSNVAGVVFGSPGGLFKYTRAGDLQTVGTSAYFGDYNGIPGATVASSDATLNRDGYWLVRQSGCLSNFGAANYLGAPCGAPLQSPIVGMSATNVPTASQGYYLAGADGGIFNYGAAPFYGSLGGVPLNSSIVGVVARPSGGYWLVAADGGVFAFGAPFYGSLGGVPLTSPIVGIASNSTGSGYWLVAADGGVFAFGSVGFFGSMGGQPIGAPIVGIARTTSNGGYWLTDSYGFIYKFGDATQIS